MTATQSPHNLNDPLAALPRQDRHRPKGSAVRPSKVSKRRAWVLIAVHVVIGLHIWHWLTTGESITPVEPSEAMETLEVGKINAGFLLFAGLIATTLIFGRWFCGWACHVVALQDLCAWILKKLSLKPRPLRSRLLVLAPWVVAGYMFVWPQVHAWLWTTFGAENGWTWLAPKAVRPIGEWQLELRTTELWETFPGPIMAVGSFLVVGFLIVWWLGAKGFCTYGCPYGAFFTLADRVAPVRVKVSDACNACGHCTSVCTSNVRVHEEVARHGRIVDPGCMKCLDCVSVCPNDALSIGLAMPKPLTTSQQRIRQRADFLWVEEILMALVAVVAVQWTFRGAWFGEPVPLLMSVGLGVITAVFTMLFLRLWWKRDVTFQHTVMKRDGARTRAGNVALLLLGGWLLFTAHTFVAQRLRAGAVDVAKAPIKAKIYSPRRFDAEQAERALDDVEAAASFALVADPQLRELRALLRGSVGRHADAEQELTALHADTGRLYFAESKMALANYLARRGELDEAERLLLEVISEDTDNPAAPTLLNAVRRRKNG
ncbi:MAG: 4Fe-4S binding protein [Planctomycetes bacterium]|nr:4Fe-4S binding protein [Planctomycetota bacterium]